jgi:hypothetical protein
MIDCTSIHKGRLCQLEKRLGSHGNKNYKTASRPFLSNNGGVANLAIALDYYMPTEGLPCCEK